MVSIIIPIYNVEKYLQRCLKSVLEQTYRNIEIILVDDGSPDNCPQMCDEWAKKDERIKVVHKVNGGVSSARNVGLNVATGEYIQFVDPDDYLEKDAIENLLKNMETFKADLMVGNVNFIENKNKISTNFAFLEDQPFKAIKKLYENNLLNGLWNKLFKKNLITFKFDENLKYYEDAKFVYEYISKCKTICCINQIIYNYVSTPNSAVHQLSHDRFKSYCAFYDYIENVLKKRYENEDAFWDSMQCRIILYFAYLVVTSKNPYKLKKDLLKKYIASAKFQLISKKVKGMKRKTLVFFIRIKAINVLNFIYNIKK